MQAGRTVCGREKEYNRKCSQSYRTEFVSVGIAVLASTVWMLTGHWMILDGMIFVRGRDMYCN